MAQAQCQVHNILVTVSANTSVTKLKKKKSMLRLELLHNLKSMESEATSLAHSTHLQTNSTHLSLAHSAPMATSLAHSTHLWSFAAAASGLACFEPTRTGNSLLALCQGRLTRHPQQ